MPDDLLAAMRQAVVDGAPETAAALARSALERGLDPLAAIQDGFVLGLN